MSELAELYTKGIKKRLRNYWAAWLPSTPFAIGDVGTLNGYVFEKECTLADLKLKHYAATSQDPSPLSLSSESGVAVSFKAAGESNPSFSHVGSTDAGVKIEFGTKGAFILQSSETYASELGDRLNLQRQVIKAFHKGIWRKEWLVVTRLILASNATVLISQSSQSMLEFTTRTEVQPTMAALGAVGAGITIKHQQGDTLAIIGGEQVTPLFQLSRLKTSFFSEPKWITKSFRAPDPSMEELTPSRLRESPEIEGSLKFDVLSDDELV